MNATHTYKQNSNTPARNIMIQKSSYTNILQLRNIHRTTYLKRNPAASIPQNGTTTTKNIRQTSIFLYKPNTQITNAQRSHSVCHTFALKHRIIKKIKYKTKTQLFISFI